MLYARMLRKRMTKAEKLLWERLRGLKCGGLKFRRQTPIGAYIVDFLCYKHSLVIEIDGGIHALQEDYDQIREKEIRKRGYKILRFTNDVVLHQLELVVSIIEEAAKEHRLPPLPVGIRAEGEGARG